MKDKGIRIGVIYILSMVTSAVSVMLTIALMLNLLPGLESNKREPKTYSDCGGI